MHKTKVKLQLSTKAGSSASGGGVLGVDGGGAFLPQPTEAPMLPTEALEGMCPESAPIRSPPPPGNSIMPVAIRSFLDRGLTLT